MLQQTIGWRRFNQLRWQIHLEVSDLLPTIDRLPDHALDFICQRTTRLKRERFPDQSNQIEFDLNVEHIDTALNCFVFDVMKSDPSGVIVGNLAQQ